MVVMFDSSLITYAVSLHFSQKVNEIVISTLQAIADETGNRFMIENKIPPHITIGAFHAAREEEAKLLQFVENFARDQKSGSVQFSEVGDFNGKVLFLKPEKILFLSEINKELHTLLLPEFEKAENGYYLPGDQARIHDATTRPVSAYDFLLLRSRAAANNPSIIKITDFEIKAGNGI